MSDPITTFPKNLEGRTVTPATQYQRVEFFSSGIDGNISSVPKNASPEFFVKGQFIQRGKGGVVVVAGNNLLVRQQSLVREMNSRLGGVFVAPSESTDLDF